VSLLAAGVTSSCSGWVVVSIYDVRVGFLSGVSLARWCVYRTGAGATLPARGVAPVGDFPGHGASPRCPRGARLFVCVVQREVVGSGPTARSVFGEPPARIFDQSRGKKPRQMVVLVQGAPRLFLSLHFAV
jgi:hypothetical protein